MSGAISYDNAIFLLAALFQLAVVRFIKSATVVNLLTAILCALLGALVKLTMLPFFVPLAIVMLLRIRAICDLFRPISRPLWSIKAKLLLVLTIISASACLLLYGGNELRFGWLHPPASVVLGDEIVYKYYAQHRRDVDFIATASERELLSLPEFIPEFFTRAIDNTLGILAHASVSRPPGFIVPYEKGLIPAIIGLLAPLAIALYKRRDSVRAAITFFIASNAILLASKFYSRWIMPIAILLSAVAAFFIERSRKSTNFFPLIFLAATFVFYAAIVMLDNYYSTYINSRILGQAIQGRYLLPVLPNLACIIAILSFSWIPKSSVLALSARLLLLEALAYILIRHGFFDVQPLMGVNFFGS